MNMPPLADFFAINYRTFVEAFVLLFAVLDAIGTAPIFVSLTKDYDKERQKILKEAVIVAAAILVVFALFGWLIFDIFDITINDFRIAGGIILFVVAVQHVMGTGTGPKGPEPTDIAVFPLATPLLAGPGAISTVVILSGPPYGPLLDLLVIGGNALLTYLLLARSAWIGRILGPDGTNALSKITALLIASLAVSFVVIGVSNIVMGLV